MIRLLPRSPLFSYIPLFSFFFNDTATTEIYPLSLLDALPISRSSRGRDERSSLLEGWGEGLLSASSEAEERAVSPLTRIAPDDAEPVIGRAFARPVGIEIGRAHV